MDNDKYYCLICDYTAHNCSNLNTHYKTKKHIINAQNNSDNSNILCKKLKELQNESNKLLMSAGVDVNSFYDFAELENSLSIYVNDKINFITKTLDETQYICTGCGQSFKLKRNYDPHVTACEQIQTKLKLFKILAIKIAVQLKQVQNHYCQQVNYQKVDIELCQKYNNLQKQFEKKIKSLNDFKIKKKELKLNYNKLTKEYNDLRLDYQKLDTEHINLKTNYQKLDNEYQKLETETKFNGDLRKEFDEQIKSLRKEYHDMSLNKFNNKLTNNGTINIILGNAPAFKYVNAFIDPLTGMPHNYNFAPERLILADNANATNEIKSGLCNGYAFHQKFLENKLVDHVAKCITHTYKNSDYSKQSFWSTDTSRGSYLVRMEGSDEDYWQKDKDGEYLKSNLMVPLINYICSSVGLLRLYNIQKYICNYEEFSYDKPTPTEVTAAYNNFVNGFNEELTGPEIQYFSKLFTELDELKLFACDDKFRKNVLIKVANKFYLDKKKCLLEYTKKLTSDKNTNKIALVETNDLLDKETVLETIKQIN
jgi:hypothetical protein